MASEEPPTHLQALRVAGMEEDASATWHRRRPSSTPGEAGSSRRQGNVQRLWLMEQSCSTIAGFGNGEGDGK